MGKLQKLRNRKLKTETALVYTCSTCMYTSSRRFNITRHEGRIHSESKKPRECCDILFPTKGDFYLHCEEFHPDARKSNTTSRSKYKIFVKTENSSPLLKNPFATSLSKKSVTIPYLLRSRVKREIHPDDIKIDSSYIEDSSPKSEKSFSESDLEDAPMDDNFDVQHSSGYETKTSFNSTYEYKEESFDTKQLHYVKTEENETSLLNDFSRFDEATEKSLKPSYNLDPTFSNESCKDEAITAGHGKTSTPKREKIIDELKSTVFDRSINENNHNPTENANVAPANLFIAKEKSTKDNENLNNLIETPNVALANLFREKNQSTKDNENLNNLIETPNVALANVLTPKEQSTNYADEEKSTIPKVVDDTAEKNFYSVAMATYEPNRLPPKKRILLSLGFANRENTTNSIKPMMDRLGVAKLMKIDDKSFRCKKHRLSKKRTSRHCRKSMASSRQSSVTNDAENIPPVNSMARKQIITGLKIDLRADERFTWDEITRLMRERLGLIDFESFKTIAR